MPTTRKKIIKTVYKDEDDSEPDGDFSDSGSDAQISEESSSDGENDEGAGSSGEEFVESQKLSTPKVRPLVKKPKFAKSIVSKINKQSCESTESAALLPVFSVKDLTEDDKLLPAVLNLSESDSSDDESPRLYVTKTEASTSMVSQTQKSDSENEDKAEYQDVFFNNKEDNSEEIARKAFLELEQHKSKIEETEASLKSYAARLQDDGELDVKDLLAQGEEIVPETNIPRIKKKLRVKKSKDDSDSDMGDWEEVKESKAIPQQGLQLIVDLPDSVCRKSKKIDVEMMMKRKMNRVKKEYQIYMHKVHVLCWLGHGNYISKVLNEHDLLAAALSLLPSKECYPNDRIDMKYLEQITTWFKDKITVKQDKNENKYKPKAPPLKEILIGQIKSRVVTAKKYSVYIFVCLLRALGLQCRIILNFVTLPIKPPSSELCSLSTKAINDKDKSKDATNGGGNKKGTKKSNNKLPAKTKIPQVDGNYDEYSDEGCSDITQLDGNDDKIPTQTRNVRSSRAKKLKDLNVIEDVSPPKRSRKSPNSRNTKTNAENDMNDNKPDTKNKGHSDNSNKKNKKNDIDESQTKVKAVNEILSPRKTRNASKNTLATSKTATVRDNKNIKSKTLRQQNKLVPPKIVVTKDSEGETSSKYFDNKNNTEGNTKLRQTRKRSKTATTNVIEMDSVSRKQAKPRTKSAPGRDQEKSKYFNDDEPSTSQGKRPKLSLKKANIQKTEDSQRISHRDLAQIKPKLKNDVTGDLINIIKSRVKEAKEESKKGIVKGKKKQDSDEDSDHSPEVDPKRRKSESDDDFKPCKVSPKPQQRASTSKKIDRRVLSSDDEININKIDVWCEVFVEELEQWISVDVIKGDVHCPDKIYKNATHPVCYVVGWDNNNHLKDITRRYVPHWNTVTRKQRVEEQWWRPATRAWLGPRTPRDREEDSQLDRMQLEAPLPKSISEYKNHPLYALQRHLLKFEALYPENAQVLGYVRGEAVYARECVHTCRSRDTWLKEAKVVRLGEKPYKIVKARPKWDKLSNKVITDKSLEVFGPWQVQDYEPPVAQDGMVPRNAYGNVELFKACMLPKGTVHIKLPGLNKVAKKLNIDCAPAMTGFDFNGGWSHPVFDGFVVCKEFEEIITEAWVNDQEDQERREREKIDARVYGNWRKLIKGLFIRERLKIKYGFEEPTTTNDKKKSKGPRLVVKKT